MKKTMWRSRNTGKGDAKSHMMGKLEHRESSMEGNATDRQTDRKDRRQYFREKRIEKKFEIWR